MTRGFQTMSYLPLIIAQSDPWKNDFFGLEGEQRFVVILLVISCVTAIIITFACVAFGVWHSLRNKQIEADIKQDMLDRGMTAEEIEQVIEATPKEGIDSWIATWKKNK